MVTAYWAAVEELNLSYYNWGTIIVSLYIYAYTHYGNKFKFRKSA